MSNNKQIAHLWANQSRESGRGSHFYFEGDTIYSYGTHFPIARHYKGAVLFTTKTYSSSTQRHCSHVRQACYHLPVFNISDVRGNPSGQDVKEYGIKISGLVKSASKARNVQNHLDGITRKVEEANRFCERFGFKTRFTVPANWEALKEKAKGDEKREQEAKARKAAKFEAQCAETVQKWLAGETVSIPYAYSKVLLRASIFDTQQILETSKGARVPLESAHLAFRFCLSKREAGWKRNGETFRVGDFKIDEITRDTVKAGCHTIGFDEILRLATTLNWV